ARPGRGGWGGDRGSQTLGWRHQRKPGEAWNEFRDHARGEPRSCTSCQSEYFYVTMNINARVPVGVFGASGYVGQELLRLLAGHPGASVAFATAESAAGERRDGIALVRIEDAPLARAEIVLSALPHGVSARHVQEARGLGKRAVDLSADFRLSPDAVYGLTEVTRPQVAAADLVANPG